MNTYGDPDDAQPFGATREESDSQQKVFGYGRGGVPWYLLLFYLSFLTLFVWYVLEYQLPDYMVQGPGRGGEPAVHSTQ